MPTPNLKVITSEEDSELVTNARGRIAEHWPEFMLHDPVAQFLTDCYTFFPRYQFVMTHPDHQDPVAIANSIPLVWEGELDDLPDDGWDWALQKGIDDHKAGRAPNILCALQIVVFSEHRSSGYSSPAVRAMKQSALDTGLAGLIAPVRPSLKSAYPIISIDDYITWQTKEGLPFDPWLRVHARVGARIVKPCPNAMRMTGTVAEWESWAGMKFPQSGRYTVPGALVPVEIDVENDLGTYVEPNVWMHHPPE